MGYLGYKPADKPLTSADITDSIITSAKIVDGTIANADINASAAIALSKLSTTGTADSTTYLRGDGAWSAVSSDYVLLASTDASSSASISFDGYFSSTYKNYQLIISDLLNQTESHLRMRFRRSNADVTSANYQLAGYQSYITSSGNALSNNTTYNETQINATRNSLRNNSAQGFFAFITIFNPLSTSSYKRMFCINGYNSNDAGGSAGSGFFGEQFYATLTDSTSALSGISIYQTTGNITSGNFKLYGIK